MTAPIFFNVARAREFLERRGFVYTLRRERKTLGETTARVGNLFRFRALGRVRIVYAGTLVAATDLAGYVNQSGFASVREWLDAAAPGADTLYRVEVVA